MGWRGEKENLENRKEKIGKERWVNMDEDVEKEVEELGKDEDDSNEDGDGQK
jgi:hypothetical protein